MQKRYFIDTSIWMDYYEDRRGHHNEPLGDYAFDFLCKITSCNDRIVINKMILFELTQHYQMENINALFRPFEPHLDRVDITHQQREEAKEISISRNIPKGDVLHAIVSRDNNLILITRDNHFNQLQDIWAHYKPEDLI